MSLSLSLFQLHPDPSSVVVLKSVDHNQLNNVLRLVYEGRVEVRKEEELDFCQAMRSLNVRLDQKIDQVVYNEGKATEDKERGENNKNATTTERKRTKQLALRKGVKHAIAMYK